MTSTLVLVRPSCGLSNSHSSTIAIGLSNLFSLIADLQCITIRHGEKQTWQARCCTWVRGTIHANNIVMMCYQKMPQMGIRQLLYCVKARWTQPFAAYWTTYVSKMEVRNETFSLIFFHSIFFMPLPLDSRGIMAWWRHQIETFFALQVFTGTLCGEFSAWRWIPFAKASDAELWCFLWSVHEQTNSWVNNRDAGDLRRHYADCDVTVMFSVSPSICLKPEIPSFCPYMGPN